MSRDRSLEEIDLVKLLLYSCIFVVVVLVMVFGYIVPNIREYKAAKSENLSRQVNLNRINQVLITKTSNLENLKNEHQKSLKGFANSFNQFKFISHANKFFTNVRLRELPAQKGENYLKFELNVTSSMKEPQNFYDFLDSLNAYENIIKADFPISMKSNNDKINTSFNIKVYGLE